MRTTYNASFEPDPTVKLVNDTLVPGSTKLIFVPLQFGVTAMGTPEKSGVTLALAREELARITGNTTAAIDDLRGVQPFLCDESLDIERLLGLSLRS